MKILQNCQNRPNKSQKLFFEEPRPTHSFNCLSLGAAATEDAEAEDGAGVAGAELGKASP